MKRSSSQLKQLARIAMDGHYSVLISSMLLFFVITFFLELIPGMIVETTKTLGSMVMQSLIMLIISLLTSVISVGLIRISLSIIRHQPYGIGDLFYAFSHYPDRFIIVAFIRALITTICQLPSFLFTGKSFMVSTAHVTFSWSSILSSLLWMLLGTILSTLFLLALALANSLMIDNDNLSALEALQKSARLMKGHKGRLFYIDISFLGLMILSIFSCYIGMLWIYPYIIMTEAFFYLDVTGELDHLHDAHSEYDPYGSSGGYDSNSNPYGKSPYSQSDQNYDSRSYPHSDRDTSAYTEYPEDAYDTSREPFSDDNYK